MGTVKKPRLDLEDSSSRSSSPAPSRGHQDDEVNFFNSNPGSQRPACEYGTKCYRRSQQHLTDFQHPQLEALFLRMAKEDNSFLTAEVLAPFGNKDVLYDQLNILRNIRKEIVGKGENKDETAPPKPNFSKTTIAIASSSGRYSPLSSSSSSSPNSSTSANPNSMLRKLVVSKPYNFFLTRVPKESSSAPLTVSFGDLFQPCLGKVKAVCHFNFMVAGSWFVTQTLEADFDEDVEVRVLCGVEDQELIAAQDVFPWLKVYNLKSPFPYGHHHTKMIFIEYEDDSIRFIVHTANLIPSDWENHVQGVWISPRCPNLSKTRSDQAIGESRTNFRNDLLRYLDSYQPRHLGTWISAIKHCDCREIRVCFVGSVPITSKSSLTGLTYGLKKMEKLVKDTATVAEADWPLLIQCSSIGSLGADDDWVRNELGNNLVGGRVFGNTFPIHVIYPSDSNVRNSCDGLNSGDCLPYSRNTHARQPWLQSILYQWRSEARQRTRTMPHIKTYCRISPDRKKLAWFLLTSANMSKAAWGKLNKTKDRLTIMSWEAGVLFLPKFILKTGQDTFDASRNPPTLPKNDLEFPVPYDLPLTKYTSSDTPWFIEALMEHSK